MQFKDKLKELRINAGLSQKQLADAIFISRSAVAKWENGLGLPSKVSYDALLDYFGITEESLPLNEVDGRRVKTKRLFRRILVLTGTISSLIIIFAVMICLIALFNGIRLTPNEAVGEYWADNEKIETQKYIFYYETTEGFRVIDKFKVVEKLPIGYKQIDVADYKMKVFDESGNSYGNLFSFEDAGIYYNIFISDIYSTGEGIYVNVLEGVLINGKERALFLNSFFETDFSVTEFTSGEKRLFVRSEAKIMSQ